jgi:predicted DNA-binding protein (UPF0251 family)
MNQGRPKKVRYIQRMPSVRQFSPRGKPGRPEEVILHIDEFEALKLSDFQMFSQEEGALAMKLSRASFGRAVREARKKIADALVNGKIIKIQMGDAQIGVRQREFTRDSLGKRPQEVIASQVKSLVNLTHNLAAAAKQAV